MKGIVLIMGMVLAALPASAASTEVLVLRGVVAADATITVTPQEDAFPLDLAAAHRGALIAVVNVRSRNHRGYTVTVTSSDTVGAGTQASLKDAATGDSLVYTLSYNGTAVAFTGGRSVLTDSSAGTGPSGVDNRVTISYGGVGDTRAGTHYTGTLTFTIAAK